MATNYELPEEINEKRVRTLGRQVEMQTWQRSEAEKAFSIKLQLWEIAEQERFGKVNRVFLRNSRGALVFWGTRRPSSLDEAVRWRENVKEFCPSIPCVLVTDNVAKEPLQWIGPGKIFESEVALDEFCKDHGFVDHFEIKSRDWESGEKSVFGQAVNCLLVEIFKNQRSG
ncbi:rab32, member RAS oncoprotein [Desmophyllum pertusum]|uniref:Rab32, member RAS oncoprotein n=1 Tax=Desmophyllum pertusum TaxID=174260 RepID=A0A9X0CNX2_9CNID|nr:rab32, member RAS oncoprotein [Desmophyllum pertusum]